MSPCYLGDCAPPTERDWSELFTSEPDTDDDEEVSGDTSDRGHGVSESGGEGEGPELAASPAAAPAEDPPTGGVARRTRAHLSLAHYDMDQLEDFLQVRSEHKAGTAFLFPPRDTPGARDATCPESAQLLVHGV